MSVTSEPVATLVATTRSAPLFTRAFAVLLVSQVCFGYAFSSYFLLPTFLATELSAGPASIGALTTATSVAAVFCMLAMGGLVDRFGRRPFIGAGALLMAVTSFAFAFVDDMGVAIYLLRLLQSLAFAMVFVASAAMTVDQAPAERLGEALGYFGVMGLSTNAVAPAIVEGLADGPGWGAAFAVAGGSALVCALLSRILPETRAPRGDEEEPPPPTWSVLRRPDQIAAGVVMACVGAAFASMFVFHQLYALELGIEHVRVFFIAYATAACASRVGFGSVGDRFGRRATSVVALCVYAGAVYAMLALADVGLAIIGIIFGLAHGVFYPTYSACAMEPVEERSRGRVVALLQAWFNMGVAIAAVSLGALADVAGYPPVFAIAGTCVVLAVAIVAGFRPRSAAAPRPG